jgi:hypothetical protein
MDPGVISDGREESLEDQIKAFSPPVEVPGERRLVLNSSLALDHLIRETYRRLLTA